MTQTAVEWLYNQLTDDWYDKETSKHILEQAKEKEKQQIISALKEGVNIEVRGAQQYQRTFEEYYKETFKK